MDFARALRLARAARGLSQKDLAGLAEIKPSYLSMLERGERKNPSAETVSRIAKALDLPVSLLILLGSNSEDLKLISQDEADRLARALLAALTQ